jgi:predicted house-cleaning noncanonical NTP pyrophosphatase (MazG superfamily)
VPVSYGGREVGRVEGAERIDRLFDKLDEEGAEAREAWRTDEGLLLELADCLEVLGALIVACGFSWDQVEKARAAKAQERGGFTLGRRMTSAPHQRRYPDDHQDPRPASRPCPSSQPCRPRRPATGSCARTTAAACARPAAPRSKTLTRSSGSAPASSPTASTRCRRGALTVAKAPGCLPGLLSV